MIAIYAEGEARIGIGHLIRTATVARELLSQGETVILATRVRQDALHGWAWSGLPISVVEAPSPRDALARFRKPSG